MREGLSRCRHTQAGCCGCEESEVDGQRDLIRGSADAGDEKGGEKERRETQGRGAEGEGEKEDPALASAKHALVEKRRMHLSPRLTDRDKDSR